MESRDRQSGLRTSRHSSGRSRDRVESRDRQSGQRGRSRTRSADNNQGSGLEASMRNLFLKKSAFDESISEIDKLREEQERRIKEVVRMNKEEEARVARESKERLEKVKKENKRRAERMRHENKIRMVVVLQENAVLEDKLVAKLQEEDQAMKASKHIIKERAAPECPVCLEEMTPPQRIFQCRNGHLLCGACRLGLPSSVCPKCRSEITGRAHDTEQFLLSAPKVEPAQNPDKPKMSMEAKDSETIELLPAQGQNESSDEIEPRHSLVTESFEESVQARFEEGVQARQQPQQSKSGTPKVLKRVTWSPSVQK